MFVVSLSMKVAMSVWHLILWRVMALIFRAVNLHDKNAQTNTGLDGSISPEPQKLHWQEQHDFMFMSALKGSIL